MNSNNNNNKVIDGLDRLHLESTKIDSNKKDSVIDDMYELYTHGARIKNPMEFKEINCAQCNKTIGWSPYYDSTYYVLYCRKCFAPIRSANLDRAKQTKLEDYGISLECGIPK